jgi:hypothetical protein
MQDRSSHFLSRVASRAAALLLGVWTLGTPHAEAATINILQKDLPEAMRVYRAHYEVDSRTDEVRVVVEYSRPEEGPGDSAGVQFTSEAFSVPELRFSRETGEILLETDSITTACARETQLLWAKWYRPTSACRLVVENQESKDGHSTTLASVSLTTGDSARLSGPK